MKQILFFLATITFFSCSTTTTNYYIVRHGEKAAVDSIIKSSDVPLSVQGKRRAEALKDQLLNKKIKYIFSTNTIRTMATALPLSDAIGVPVQIYSGTDTGFVRTLKNLNENILIVGHSNTVDDLVNGLLGKEVFKDLPDSRYGDLFIVHKKKNKFTYDVGSF